MVAFYSGGSGKDYLKMDLYTKDVEKIGFKGSGIFASRWYHFYYAKVVKTRKVGESRRGLCS